MMKILAMLSLLLLPFMSCQSEMQNSEIWLSEDWRVIYFKITLVPEEDSAFHWGVWGLERGNHVFEASFYERPFLFEHSEKCSCLEYR